MKSKLFLLLALSAFVLGACAKGGTSEQSSVAPAPSSETTSTSESSAPSSEDTRVTELSISGVVAPVAGGLTSISSLTTNEEDAIINYDACWWLYVDSISGEEYLFANADESKEFEQGMKYGIQLVINLENKLFSNDPDICLLFDGGDALAPERVHVYPGNRRIEAYFFFSKLPGPVLMHRVNILNYLVPVVGEVAPVPYRDIPVDPSQYVRVDQGNTYWIYYSQWGSATYFSRGNDDTAIFEAGVHYALSIILQPKDETEAIFAEDVVVFARGVQADISRAGEFDLRVIIDFGTL